MGKYFYELTEKQQKQLFELVKEEYKSFYEFKYYMAYSDHLFQVGENKKED